MAKTYSWHSGSHCVSPRWTVHVPLLPDEIISSWLVRAALTQGCDPLVLTGHVWEKWRVWTLDVDRCLSEERLKPLSVSAGIPIKAFQSATLYQTASRINRKPLPEKATWPWMLTLGSRNTKRRGGLQYCPVCLSEDAKPYYRLHWRFAWHTVCDLHKCSLLDRCWHCNMPVEPHRLIAEDQQASVCASCKANLGAVKTPSYPAEALLFQKETDRIVQENDKVYFGRPITIEEWFELVHFFMSLIRKTNRSNAYNFTHFMRHINVTVPQYIPIMPGAGVELLRTQHRQQIFVALWHLFSLGKNEFEDALRNSGITRQGLFEKGARIPDHLAGLVETLANISRKKRASPVKRCSLKPRPKSEVMRKIDKLQRKLEMIRHDNEPKA